MPEPLVWLLESLEDAPAGADGTEDAADEPELGVFCVGAAGEAAELTLDCWDELRYRTCTTTTLRLGRTAAAGRW